MPAISPANSRGTLATLMQALEGPGRIVILPHDNPDPDSLACAADVVFSAAFLLASHVAAGLSLIHI